MQPMRFHEMMQSACNNWDSLCEEGRKAASGIDAGRWIIGELAGMVKKGYGDHGLEGFAKEINVSLKRVYEYRKVVEFYTFSAAAEFCAQYPNITYTHFRHAMRLKARSTAFAFLIQCIDNDWTSDRAAIELKRRLGEPIPPKTLLDAHGHIEYLNLMTSEPPRVVLVLDQGVDVFALQRVKGKLARILVVEDEGETKEDTAVSSQAA